MPKKSWDVVILIAFILALGIAFYEVNISLNNPMEVRDYVESFGAFGPLIVIFLIIMEVILAPVPGIIIAIGSGYAFGALKGTLYSYIGNVIGTSIAFALSRHFGRPLAKRLIRIEKLNYYDRFFRERGIYGLWFAYIFPIFPTDIISFVTGLSSIKFKRFIRIVLIGFIPNMLFLNYFGDRMLRYGFGTSTIMLGSLFLLMFIFMFLFVYKKKTI